MKAGQMLETGSMAGEYAEATWVAANFEAAEFLPDDTYRHLQIVYAQMPLIRTSSSRLEEETRDEMTLAMLDDWINKTNQAVDDILKLDYASGFREQWRKLPRRYKPSIEWYVEHVQSSPPTGGETPETEPETSTERGNGS